MQLCFICFVLKFFPQQRKFAKSPQYIKAWTRGRSLSYARASSSVSLWSPPITLWPCGGVTGVPWNKPWEIYVTLGSTLCQQRFVLSAGKVMLRLFKESHKSISCSAKKKQLTSNTIEINVISSAVSYNISFIRHFFHGKTWAQRIDLLSTVWLRSSVG